MNPSLIHTINTLPAANVAELNDTAQLLTRRDRKYIIDAPTLSSVIHRVREEEAQLKCLQTESGRWARYESTYYDTGTLDTYRLAATRRPNRFKARVRRYVDGGWSTIEFKTKNRRGQTVKQRAELPASEPDELAETNLVRQHAVRIPAAAPFASRLVPGVSTRYRRATLLLPSSSSRVTIDADYTASDRFGRTTGLPGHYIVETKTSGRACAFDRAFWAEGVRPVKFSKYATGLAKLRPDLTANRWSSVIRRYFDSPVTATGNVAPPFLVGSAGTHSRLSSHRQDANASGHVPLRTCQNLVTTRLAGADLSLNLQRRNVMTSTYNRRLYQKGAAIILGWLLVTLAACSATQETNSQDAAAQQTEAASATSDSVDGTATQDDNPGVTPVSSDSGQTSNSAFDSSSVHELTLAFDEAAYQAMIEAYTTNGDKEWIEATVTIDGTAYNDVGLRLKGNSSLRGLADGGGPGGDLSSENPETLPWLIKLDKYVDDQDHLGVTDFVVRSSSTGTSLNEAVALELLAQAGLATQQAMSVRFSVNGSAEVLRLVIENPDDEWMSTNFDASGALYKAESTGDYSYRGDNPEEYDEVFDQEAGEENADLTPLIEFLDFINNADDETFAAELDQWLDVDEFATYLAMEEIVENFDDIDGPGNNSYLYYDSNTEQFTVVAWDHNLAFGVGPGGAGGNAGPRALVDAEGQTTPDGGEAPAPGEVPDGSGFQPPAGFDQSTRPEGAPQPPDGFVPGGAGNANPAGRGGPGGRSNVLSERFLASEEFLALYNAKLEALTADLIDTGTVGEVAQAWAAVIERDASDLVSSETIQSEVSQIVS